MTSEIPSRDLRNDVSAVLRRVEAGETLVVNVSGRSVARLVPLATRPTSIPTSTLFAALERVAADRDVATELRDALPETTDDVA
jgi:prevent-host-death family protein